jgi:hypothetical protein
MSTAEERMQSAIEELEQENRLLRARNDRLEAEAKVLSVQELGWKWFPAPTKTQWGNEMVVTDLAIDKDRTVSVYCERDQTAKVEAMFTQPAAQRQWVGLSPVDRGECLSAGDAHGWIGVMEATEAKLKDNNS